MIDKRKIKKSFNAHAHSYDQSARFQQKIAGEVIEQVRALGIYPHHLLDIGTGTGYLALALKELFVSAVVEACDIAYGMVLVARAKGMRLLDNHLRFISADAEYLPYREERFDLVVSNLTYQWLSEWRYAFQEVLRVLKGGGLFMFTTLGTRTFFELRDSYLCAYRALGNSGVPHLHSFIRKSTLRKILNGEGFTEVTVKSRFEREYYGSVKELLTNLKTIGAQNASRQNPSGLGKPKVFRRMVDTYEEGYRDGLGIPATYEVLFGCARKE